MSSPENNSSTPKPKCDPGWNDPPLFSYDNISKAGNKTKKGPLLNKRIAFPLGSSSASSPQGVDPTAPPSLGIISTPPPISNIGTNLHSTITTTSSKSSENSLDSSQALQLVLENLESVLSKCEFNNKKPEEIRKRLDIMKKMWEENKFQEDIHNKMVILSEALKRGDIKEADHIHIGLMVDHVALCSSWMVGIRHLIQHAQSSQTENDKPSE